MARVNNGLGRSLQALRKCNIAWQQAGDQQRRAGLMHGMQVQQVGGPVNQRAQRARAGGFGSVAGSVQYVA